MNNTENKPINREVKIMLLQALKRGYFNPVDINLLSEKTGFEPVTIEIIDRREQVKKTAL
jgi:endonuclease V-like protein UPF0215 family